MKAGQALGLLAGMGALSALGRGADLKGNRFTGLLDMIDGGGGGKSGDRFEGGGLLSMLGNLFAKPYEAQQRVEDIAARAAARNVTPSTTGGSEPMSTQPLLDAAPVGTGNPLVDRIIQDRKEQVVMDQPVVPSVTTPNLTDAQKEAIVMSQVMPPAAFDYRNFQQGTEPSTLTEAQRLQAAGILANQDAVVSRMQRQAAEAALAGNTTDAMNNTQYAVNLVSDMTEKPPAAPDPMGLLARQTMTPPSAVNMDTPEVGALLNVPSAPPSQEQTMLQSLSATIPPAAEQNDPIIVQDYKDYVMAGGTDDYKTFYRSRPEYIAERQLFEETNGNLFNLPEDQRKKLIRDRADMIRRATPKNVPFTGPAF